MWSCVYLAPQLEGDLIYSLLTYAHVTTLHVPSTWEKSPLRTKADDLWHLSEAPTP